MNKGINKHFISPKSRRHIRYAKNLQKEIASIIIHNIKDPGINGLISVLDVTISNDFLTVYVRIRVFTVDKKNIYKSIEALRRSSGYISSILSSTFKMRRAPKLIFNPINDHEYETTWLKQYD